MEPLIRKRMKIQKETQIGDRFEWGWLIEEGFLDQPRWLSYCTIFGSKFSEHCTRVDNARRMELFLAISRAHDAAEFDLDICPEYAAHFIQESKQIKVQADKEYAALALLSPDIASAVTTRQTCQLVLKDYLHQVEILFESAQLKATDFASMKEDILSKRRKLLDYLPKTDETFISKLRQENLRRYFPEDSRLIKKMTKQRFKAGEMVLDGKRIAEAIYFIEQGTVQLQLGEDEGGLTMCGDGCCINDTQVLIDDAGFEFENVSDVIAVTDATLHCLTFQSLRDINDELGKHEKDSFVHKLWQHAGSVLSLRCPELFDFSTPPAAFQWASSTMVVKEKGASLILSGRCLLVQGVLEKWSRPSAGESRSNLRRNKNNVNKQEAELNTIEAFAYLSPTECDGYAFTVLTDNCKLLLSPQTICKKADEANVELSTRRPEASVPENEEVPGDEDRLVWGCDWGCGFVGRASVVRRHEHTCDQRRRQREQSRTSKELSRARGLTRGGLDSLPEKSYTRRDSVAGLSCDSIPAQLAVCYSQRSSLYSVPPLLPSPLEAACTTRQHPPHTEQLEAELQTADGTSAKSRRRKSVV
jgi:CRP-like cAMP-binding protein